MTSIRLNDIERHSWRMTTKDGLLDILFGFMLLGACVSSLVSLWETPDWLRLASLSSVQFGGLGFIGWMRRREVQPRIGRVKFGSKRVRSTRNLRLLMIVCVAATLILVLLTTLSARLGFSIFGKTSALSAWAIITAVIMIPIGGLAYYHNYPRLLLHGSFFVIAEFLHIVVGWPLFWPPAAALSYGIGSLISFSIGIPIFLHFLRTMPRISAGEYGGSDV
ncbi:MAG: hypothetical protein E4H08_03210 [Candidatus Atribacteria bacterium]|nr:MAG: hypothetical protein E4H08_03210 [Candidatus Atribacteria bacterium]